ncbi:MAG: hypothetical protein J0H07_25335 [Sphingobacteriales bacterium]|nr:hypothetical protein [Sphingobacteriales bacterium]
MNTRNWAGNIEYSTPHIHHPRSVEEVQTMVRQLKKCRVLGTRHCFNRIADSKHHLISTSELNKVISLDPAAKTVTVAGSIATATHGSGIGNGNLATAVTALEVVTGDGEIRAIDDKEMVHAAAVNLGILGVMTKVTLSIQPRYHIRQTVYEQLPVTKLTKHFEKILSAGYSVSLFTDWRRDTINEVWVKSKMSPGEPDMSDEPHGAELQSEYFVPFHHGVEALLAISRLGPQISPHLFISEIRTVAADELWLSPNGNQDSVALHFTWRQDWPAVSRLLPLIEKELAPFQARPHWGKLFTMPPVLLKRHYEKLDDFKQLAAKMDPEGKFRNEFVSTCLY